MHLEWDAFDIFSTPLRLAAICDNSIQNFQQAVLGFLPHCPKHTSVILLLIQRAIGTERIEAVLLSETLESSEICTPVPAYET